VLFEIDNPDPVHTLNGFATPTPVADGEHLYCDFGTYGTACLESATGRVVWKTRLPLDHEVGPGSSPVVWKDLLILVRDGCDTQYVTALDKKTGEQRWKTMRPPLEGSRTDSHKSFATPAFIGSDGGTQMVVPGAQWLVSYDPASGAERWRCNHGKGFSIAGQPSVGNGLVIYFTGFSGSHIRAVRHDGTGDVSDSHVAWECRKWVPTIPSPVLVGKELYWVSDSGTACCADATSGEIIWHQSLGGRFRASPIHAAGRLYLIDEAGTCQVLKAGREFELLQENRLDSQEVTATPAFVGKSVVIRTHTHLYRIGKDPG
jgi:outer membrane protein assembly factor BamB